MIASELVSDTRLMTGTMWHNFMHQAIVRSGVPFMQEIKLDRWLPEGWSGTADWIFYDAEAGGFVLGDLKTSKGEALRWVKKDGAKTEHLWQLSAYWHALFEAGLPLVKGFAILYLPMNDVASEEVEPVVAECEPLDRDVIWTEMETRWSLTQEYLGDYRKDLTVSQLWSLYSHPDTREGLTLTDVFVNDRLAPPMAREQKLIWNGKTNVFDVKLVPHWSTRYCPFDDELCDCSTQGVTKIGHWELDDVSWVPYKGSPIEPLVQPTYLELEKRRAQTVSI